MTKEQLYLLKMNYKGLIEDEFKEDLTLFCSIRRVANFFQKNPSFEKIHSLYNKIFISIRQFDREVVFNLLINDMDNEDTKNLIIFIIAKYFDMSYDTGIEIKEEWKAYLNIDI